MKLEMVGQMRMEQRMKLAPHMIQSMEILQLPILALRERIEQEITKNPLLETDESADPHAEDPVGEGPTGNDGRDDDAMERTAAMVNTDTHRADDFEHPAALGREPDEYVQGSWSSSRAGSDELDAKQRAMNNAAAPPHSLHDHLSEQWRLVEARPAVRKAGQVIIDFIDDRGYLGVRLEQLHRQDQNDFTIQDLHEALRLVQTLEPAGVGARDLKECLLLQMDPKDLPFEMDLVSQHMDALLENRLPEIAKKMGCSLDRVNLAVERLRRLDTSPGLQISQSPTHPIVPDVLVEPLGDGGGYGVRLADDILPSLRLNDTYLQMAKDTQVNEKTREFLRNNVRSAQWILEAIQQRRHTLLKVARAIVHHQREFFDKGPLYLKPLPMGKVAEDVGVHVATVSRAAAGKHMQCPWGILPLRKFFSGGTGDEQGQEHSWEAIRVQLQRMIDSEDKTCPLSDDQIRQRLASAGFARIARRTVAKYRGLLNIPAARFRRRY